MDTEWVTFLSIMLIYSSGHLLTVAVIIVLYPKIVLDIGTEDVTIPLVHFLHKNL